MQFLDDSCSYEIEESGQNPRGDPLFFHSLQINCFSETNIAFPIPFPDIFKNFTSFLTVLQSTNY
jgi:hypothetical protein